MSRRALYLDEGFGERRGVVTLDGRPERLLIERDGDPARRRLGARFVARVASWTGRARWRSSTSAAEEAVLNLGPERKGLTAGRGVEVEIRAEARRGKARRRRG